MYNVINIFYSTDSTTNIIETKMRNIKIERIILLIVTITFSNCKIKSQLVTQKKKIPYQESLFKKRCFIPIFCRKYSDNNFPFDVYYIIAKYSSSYDYLNKFENQPTSCIFSSNQDKIIVGTNNGSLIIMDLITGKVIKNYKFENDIICNISSISNNSIRCLGYNDNTSRFNNYNLESLQKILNINYWTLDNVNLFDIKSINTDTGIVYFLPRNQDLILYKILTNKEQKSICFKNNKNIIKTCLSKNNQTYAVLCEDKIINFWNIKPFISSTSNNFDKNFSQYLKKSIQLTNDPNCLEFASDDEILFCGCNNGIIEMVNLTTYNTEIFLFVGSFKKNICSISLCSSNIYIGLGFYDGHIGILDLRDGTSDYKKIHQDKISTLIFSSKDKLIVTISEDKSLSIIKFENVYITTIHYQFISHIEEIDKD